MKLAVCFSHEKPILKYTILRPFSKYIIRENNKWAERFCEYLAKYKIDYDVVYIDKSNWIEEISKYNVVIWKPDFMGVRSSQLFRDKVFFIQNIMGKRIYPNYQSVWHFDNKISQHYFFQYKRILTPKTFVSHDYNETIEKVKKINYPVVVKEFGGAGSTGVRLAKSFKKMVSIVNKRFLYENIISRKINSKRYDKFGEIYIQEYLKDNDGDLRINIIGNRYATGFWRKNRENDFRASGSGKIDYESEIPKDIIKYCSQISRENNFDSMAYDILFDDNDFYVVEMSYGYNDTALYNAKGYYTLDDNGDIVGFNKGNYWPQELWIKWIIEHESLLNN